jgi:hypothetical protein
MAAGRTRSGQRVVGQGGASVEVVMGSWSLFRCGVHAAVFAGMLILPFQPASSPSTVAAKSSTYTYQVDAIADDTKLCVQPLQTTTVRVIVRRYKDGKLNGRAPRIGVTVDVPHYGSVSPPSDFTNAFGAVRITYTPLREGTETLKFYAIGYDHGRPVQVPASTQIEVVRCTYRYTLSGNYETPEAPGMAYKAKLFGEGIIQIHDDGTLDGSGDVTVGQSMKFDVNTGAAKITFTGNNDSAPFTIKGKIVGEHLLLEAPIFSVVQQPMTYTAKLQGHTIVRRIGGGTIDQNFVHLPTIDFDVAGGDAPIDLNHPPSTGSTLVRVDLVMP